MTDRRHEIESLLVEGRSFPPVADAVHVRGLEAYRALAAEAKADPGTFWGRLARELHWTKPFGHVMGTPPPAVTWFADGETNLCANALDRHVAAGRGDHTAILWEGEPGEVVRWSFRRLLEETCRFAAVLTSLGVRCGDRVAVYLPLVPEAAAAMLACARIGAVHTVIFGGFSAPAVRGRVEDAGACVVVTADGGWRRGKEVPLKPAVDEAVAGLACVRHVLVVRRTGTEVAWTPGRDRWWHEERAHAPSFVPAASLPAEHPLFILYTSGTTGKPKGILHTTGGYMVGTWATARWVFDLRPDDVFWCTADVGWVTGHSYVVYGILLNGVTTVMYEGAPAHPAPDRFWSIIARHRVTVLYTAPTAIRAFMRLGDAWPARHDLSSLRLLGSVGEPINPEAWAWYRRVIGGDRCPIVDTWWQTETGMILVSPLPGATPTRPGSATLPLPGIEAAIVDAHGKDVPDGSGGLLVLRRPWPAMMRTLWRDDARHREVYWDRFSRPGAPVYLTGDGAVRDPHDGYLRILGRVDDVLNVSGHRLSTMEVESALVGHDAVAEAACVARPDPTTGEAVCAFVTLKQGQAPSEGLRDALRHRVEHEIGKFARPADVRFTDALPKTRSGKIMRRLLRDVAAGREVAGDTSTLEDYSVLARLREEEE
jgi:acetyl-CoA synthetase